MLIVLAEEDFLSKSMIKRDFKFNPKRDFKSGKSLLLKSLSS